MRVSGDEDKDKLKSCDWKGGEGRTRREIFGWRMGR